MKKGKYVILVICCLILISFLIVKMILPGITFVKPVTVTMITSSVHKFKYQPEKAAVGTVYHYVKSNIDGSKPGKVTVYIASANRLEVFKIYPGANATFLVTADFDWNTFSPKELTGYERYQDGTQKTVVHGSKDPAGNAFIIADGKQKYTVPIGHYPFHNYNFDLISLSYSFRYLLNPEGQFEIGVHYPAFSLFSYIKFVYLGKAKIKYVTEEKYGADPCRKYEISGAGVSGKRGYIWVNKELGYVENIEIPLSDNPAWSSFKFRLSDIEKMSAEEWNNYIVNQTKEYFKSKQ